MSTKTYPAFCSLNQPDLELLSMPVPVDQAINSRPIFDETAWHDSLMATFRLFEEFLSGTAPCYSNTASSTAGDLPSVTQQTSSPGEPSTPTRETISPASGESYSPTRELIGPVRSKRAHFRVVHACDECRHKKKKCSGEQPLCLSCQKAGRTCSWTPIKTTKNRSCLKYGVVKLYRPTSRTCERDSMTRPRYPHIVAPKPTYPIRLQDIQSAANLASAVRNAQTVSSPSWVGPPAQIATRRTRTVDFDWSDLGSSEFSQEWIPPPPTRPAYFCNVLSPVHPLYMRESLRHEDIYRRALDGQ
ncbi:hypothetical protein EDB19DRAFT_1668977 [Suillus lakei]|nr:hypothetical protein EDB19DRAFT_1668977 [Suillus lakei]